MLKAVHHIRGVKAVTKGKGKGTKKAHPGDLFEPHDKVSGDKLLRDGSAILANESLPNTGPKFRGPDVIQGEADISKIAERIEPEDLGEDETEAEEAPQAKPAKATKAKGKPAKDEGGDLDELGL